MRKISWKVKGSRKQWIYNQITLERIFDYPVYNCYIYVDDENKLILKMHCECPSFSGIATDKEGNAKYTGNKKIREFGKGFFKKYYSEPCKHLKKVTDAFERIGYKFKIPKMEGTEKPTAELKRFLIERSGGICERNYCENYIREIHRIIPKTHGGKYNKDNCVYLCFDCHKLIPIK